MFNIWLQYDQGINDIIKNGASFKVLTEKLAHYQRQLRLVQDELHQTLHVGRYEIKLNRLKGFLEDRVSLTYACWFVEYAEITRNTPI